MKSTGYILNGMYHEGTVPIDTLKDGHASTDKQYQHDKQRQEHARDLIQPYTNGKPNPAFIEQYPEESTQYGFNKS